MIIPQKNTEHKDLRNILIVALLVAGLVSVLFNSQAALYTLLDHSIYDSFLKSAGRAGITDQVVVADIDDISLAAVGQWPWPRYRIATLLQSLLQHSPALIGVDIIFPEPDRTSLDTIRKAFSQEFGLNLGFTGLPPGLSDNDGFLGQVLSQSPVVGAKYFYFDHSSDDRQCTVHPLKLMGDISLISPLEATGILCNIENLDSQLQSSGFINNQFDRDGVLRKLPLLMKYRDRIYPNLSLEILAQYIGAETVEISRDFFGTVLRLNEFTIPVDRQGYLQLRFGGPGKSHHFISAVDLLNDAVDAEELNGKIFLIGASAAGLNDLHHTVFDPSFPGIETHAVFLSNVFNSQFIRIPDWQPVYIVIACLLAGVLSGAMFCFFLPIRAVLLTCGWLALFTAGSFFLFTSRGIYFSPTGPVMVSTIMVFLCSFIRYFTENKRAVNWIGQLARVQQVTLEAMATVAETRDPETGGHIQRTKRYVKVLAEYLRDKEKDDGMLTDDYIEALFHSAPLHDVGKVGIPDHILLKPGPLDKDEFSIMKRHSEYGVKIINSASDKLEDHNFLEIAAEIAATHHEKWDGSGYPNGMKGKEIPISGRLMAVADVYDALISKRQYKEPFTHEKSKAIILEGQGTHFDPVIIEAFLAVEQAFINIAQEFEDDV